MRSRLACFTAIFWFGTTLPATAVELIPSWETRVGWDSNIFATADQEDAGVSIEGGPDLRLRKRQGDVTYDWIYRLRYEDFPSISDADAFDQVADGRARWDIDGRTWISTQANLARTKNLNRLRDLVGPIDPGLDLSGEVVVARETLLRHGGNLTFTRQISPQLQFQALIDSSYFAYNDDARTDSYSINSSLQLTRAFTSRLRAGGGVSLLRQDFSESDTSGERISNFYQTFAIVQYQVTPLTLLSFQAGPSWFEPADEEDDRSGNQYALRGTTTGGIGIPLAASSCLPLNGQPGNPRVVSGACQPAVAFDLVNGGGPIFSGLPVRTESVGIVPLPFVGEIENASGAVTIFGRVSLTRRFENADLSLSYQRRANSAAGIGTSTNLDIASGSYDWRIDRKWRLRIAAAWQHQQSSSDVPQNLQVLANGTGETLFFDDAGRLLTGPTGARWQVFGVGRVSNLFQSGLVSNAIDITTYTAQVKIDRRVTEHSKVFVLGNFLRQETDSDFRTPQTLDDFRIQLGFNWEFDAIEL